MSLPRHCDRVLKKYSQYLKKIKEQTEIDRVTCLFLNKHHIVMLTASDNEVAIS